MACGCKNKQNAAASKTVTKSPSNTALGTKQNKVVVSKGRIIRREVK